MKRPFPVDPALTAIAIGYRNPAHALIGRRVLPPLPVTGETYKWTEFDLAEGFTVPETLVARKGQPNQVEFTGSEKTGATKDYGLDDGIPHSDIREAARLRAEHRSTIDPEAMAAQGLTNLIELAREKRVADKVQDYNNYAATRRVTLLDGNQFNDAATDVLGICDTAIEGLLVYRANHVVMGQPVWASLKKHPKLIKAIKQGDNDTGFITKQQFADLFELKPENILIGEGWINAARKGQNVNLGRVWGKNFMALYIDPAKQDAEDSVLTFGFTAENGGRVSGSIEDKDIGLEGGKRVRVGEKVNEEICAKDLGYMVKDAVE
jgi:hypothetical protein